MNIASAVDSYKVFLVPGKRYAREHHGRLGRVHKFHKYKYAKTKQAKERLYWQDDS